MSDAERSIFLAGPIRAQNSAPGKTAASFIKTRGAAMTNNAGNHETGKTVERLFLPAVAMMSRLSYTKKFTVLWLLSFVAIAVVAYGLFASLNRVILTSQRQLGGIELIEPVFRAMQVLQQHRAQSATFLGGNDAAWKRVATQEKETEEIFKTIERKLPPNAASIHDYLHTKADWALLRKEGLHFTADENFSAHSRLIERVRLFGVNIADEYALTTKSEIDTFYLIDTVVNKLPDALEHFGQIRGYSSGILSRKQIAEHQKMKLNSLIVELRSALDELNTNLEKTSRHNPALRESIPAIASSITGSAYRVTDLVESDILTGRLSMASDDFYNVSTVAINKGYTQMYDSLLPMINTLIEARIAHAKNTLYLSTGIASLLFLLVAYFSVGIYYAVIGNIRSITDSASAFANGDMRKRISLDTRDEISQVGDSFNQMADGFTALLESHRLSEEVIWRQANFDSLTGLPNRRMFHDRLEQEIKKAHRAGLKIALLFIDLDKFKEINDTLGHSMGDALLVEAARRIVSCVRETDTVARLGGDEFTAILAELGDTASIERVTENILLKLAEPFHLGAKMAYVSGSIGITLYPDDATEVECLLKNADQAMYVAKNAGRNRFGYFTPALQQAAQAKLQLHNDLRCALAAGQLRVYYQPIVELATGNIHKAEALVRWQHPERGLVSPAQFIPLAEETGLIVEIGNWVFREAAQQVGRWRDSCNPRFQISVNKSPVQFRQFSDARDAWPDHLRELGLPGQSIAIEITESLLLDTEDGIGGKLVEFRNAGIQVAIDDFGTGYSSLSYLKKFNIDYLKIDQSFTRNLTPGSNDMALSEAIIVMAHRLGLKVIAEGVETEAQHMLLATAGCDYAQGYLFSRPVPANEFEALPNLNCKSLPAGDMSAETL